MTPSYETLTPSSVLDSDQNMLDSMLVSNNEELKKLDEKVSQLLLQLSVQGLLLCIWYELLELGSQLDLRNRHLNPHLRFYTRELRVVVYTQFLESYKSVTIETMATHIWCLR